MIAALAAPEIQADERSVHVVLNEPFEINGERFDAGRVSLREVSRYTPQTTMNEIWVDETCLGLMMADASDSIGRTSDDRILFERDADGTLLLVGFAYRGERTHEFNGRRATAWLTVATN